MAELPPFEVMAKKVAENILDGFVYNGKTLREWVGILAQTQWIPISERLPEDDTRVLVTIQVGNREPRVRSGYYCMDGFFDIDNGEWGLHHGWKEHLTLERIDVNGNYEPTNCKWIPMSEQYKNKQSNHNKNAVT